MFLFHPVMGFSSFKLTDLTGFGQGLLVEFKEKLALFLLSSLF